MCVWGVPTLIVVGAVVRVLEKSRPFANGSEIDGREGVLGYAFLFTALLDFIFVSFWAISAGYTVL